VIRAGASLALWIALSGAAPARAQTEPPAVAEAAGGVLTLDEYRAALAGLAADIDQGEWERARSSAEALRGAQVATEAGPFEADPTVVEAVVDARDATAAARARLRIDRLLPTLGAAAGSSDAPDAALLERLAREQAARRPTAGGDVDVAVNVPAPSLPQRLSRWLDRAMEAFVDFVLRLWRWLTRFGPRPAREGESSFTGPVVALLVGVIVAVLAAFTIQSLRRRGEPEERGEAGEASSRADENPLSREAGEWERYAAELAAAGRLREAIRAWYHAVLVTLFRAGRLHHQQGRTNWEYVSQVGPEARWRPAFIELTQAFEREWYGRSQSAAEALRACAGTARDVLRAVRGEAAA
jgi:hypothetical protein